MQLWVLDEKQPSFQLQSCQLDREGLDSEDSKAKNKKDSPSPNSIVELCIIIGWITYVACKKKKKANFTWFYFYLQLNEILALYIDLPDVWLDNYFHILRNLFPQMKLLMVSKVHSSFYISRLMFSMSSFKMDLVFTK